MTQTDAARSRAGATPGTAGTGGPRVAAVTERLVTAIATGQYLPGSRLPPERDLAAALGAGRMTVRAALAHLARRGLIETHRGRHGGSFVLQQWPDSSTEIVGRTLSATYAQLRDLCEAIARLHGAVCRAAAEHRSPADLERIEAALEVYAAAGSGLASQQADSALHLALIDAAHNDTLRRVLADLEGQLSIGAPAHLWGAPEGMHAMEARALREHRDLVAAVAGRRADDAERIARAHVAIDLELLSAALARTGALPAGTPTAP
ncbi:DNA-binding FadR family transcriptional regulator [Kineococcus radiotolerans]|uniref:DNA-binding FadR family transcriptional regulator n=1 Tax=Kineococcus radiotolerans TaxID=131568 RepID=A0A7W4TLJ2_KINRA|nr:GntR family transcriptional regulator [Kineococcus radiotolerans]MBB2900808.1 DNA-binding FadR family transcriptional regulator [Kineococcus radiotolerans]